MNPRRLNSSHVTRHLSLASALALAALTSAGCTHRLPNLKASEIHSRTTAMGWASEANAHGISITDTTLRAAHAEWKISFPGFDHVTVAKDYQQRREKEPDEKKP